MFWQPIDKISKSEWNIGMNQVNTVTAEKLFPADAAVRETALSLYALVSDLPIVSPHGHVDPRLLLENKPFANPAELFIYFDHYVTRLLHANGVALSKITKTYGVDAREAWRELFANWHVLLGTASGYWLTQEFETLFDLRVTPSAANADEVFDLISDRLQEPDMLPRALFSRFKIEFLATTDDPCDDLAVHKALRDDPTFDGVVVPTFRPDNYLDPRNPNFVKSVERLLQLTERPARNFVEYLEALRIRRDYFIAHGAVSTDHGVYEPFTTQLSDSTAEEFFQAGLSGHLSPENGRLFAGHMLTQMARMSSEDGLVMTVHAGVFRNHHQPTLDAFGPDSGHDIPVKTEFVHNLHTLLNLYGTNPNLKLILFALDETTWSREIAPLAGFYPSVYVGAPWWFMDAPDSAMRFREAVTESAGFYKGSGFIDDTRAFLSIPARHDMARRIDCSYLARLVHTGRLSLEQAETIAVDLVVSIPRRAFNI
jgi:glucuronate isomerase